MGKKGEVRTRCKAGHMGKNKEEERKLEKSYYLHAGFLGVLLRAYFFNLHLSTQIQSLNIFFCLYHNVFLDPPLAKVCELEDKKHACLLCVNGCTLIGGFKCFCASLHAVINQYQYLP